MFNLDERIMKKKLIIALSLFIFILTSGVQLNAQVTIGGSPAQPPQSFSILELVSGKNDSIGGLRLPQMTEANKTAINSELLNNEKSKGLFIYNTEKGCIEYWDGTQWIDPIDKLPWQITPGSPIIKNFADVTDSIYHTGAVSVGTKKTDPSAVLYVQSDSMGIVVPSMTEAQRDKIKKPANGLVIFNTDEQCFNYYSLPDTTWQSVCGKLGKATIDSAYCSQIKVFGSYIKGVETTVNERIVIPVEVNKIGSYDITVVAMYDGSTDNGYTFTASGTFLYEGRQTITLTAQGTPKNEHYDPSDPTVGDRIQINFNGTQLDPGCNAVVIPVVPATADYSISCGSALVYGVYTMAPDMTNSDDATHYIEVQVNVNDIGGGLTSGWSAETNSVSGVQFRGSGKFSDADLSVSPKIRLYAVAGTKATTLDPIVLTMTFQTKNGAVNCQVTLRAAFTPKKIVVFGTADITYGYALNTGQSQGFLSSQANFGSANNSTVKMVDNFTVPSGYTKYGAFAYRYAGVSDNLASNWTQIMNEKPDIVIITYNADEITSDGAKLFMQYMNAGGIVLQFTENNPCQIVSAVFGIPFSTLTAARYGNGEWCTLANYNDPILNGPFQPVVNGVQVKTLGGLNIFGDTEPTLYGITGLPGTGILIYGYNNQTTTGLGLGSVSAFRATGQSYCYFGEGGFFCNTRDSSTPLSNIQPFVTTGPPDFRPAVRVVATSGDSYYKYQQTSPYPGGYNSFYFGNMMAWAINQAQFYGINSGQ